MMSRICFKITQPGGRGGAGSGEEAGLAECWKLWDQDGCGEWTVGGTGPFCSGLNGVPPNSHVEVLTPRNYKYDLIWREDGRVTS